MRQRLLQWTTPILLFATLGASGPADPLHFSIILERDGRTWRAACETGCTWDSLTAHKPWFLSSRVLIDETGVHTSGATPDSSVTFAFRVTADGSRGWTATTVKGTAWRVLSFTCPSTSCRARITEVGVEVVQ